ncbi:MAG: hypothetical protein ABW004_02270, partial [Aeromicrobium sp.]
MTSTSRPIGSAALAALVMSSVLVNGAATPSAWGTTEPPSPTEVVPSDLPAGPGPRVAHHAGQEIVRPGRASLSVPGVGEDTAVLRVHKGYLLSTEMTSDLGE